MVKEYKAVRFFFATNNSITQQLNEFARNGWTVKCQLRDDCLILEREIEIKGVRNG